MSEHALRLVRLGLDTHQESIVYMRADCHVCRSEGFAASSRVIVATGGRSIVATLCVATGETLLRPGEAGLSESAWQRLGATSGHEARISHAPLIESMRSVRRKVYGQVLSRDEIDQVLRDVAAGLYSDVEISALLTACTASRMNVDEVVALTRGMVEIGERLRWPIGVVADKHCVGGLPGNRTTPIVVAILAALGVRIPKTSSRAITSPAGTADTMETLAPVDLDLSAMRRVVEREGGCVVWGGAVRLSPVDDVLIRIERALDIDSDAQLVASVLSKKLAAGSTHVVIDLPVGPTAKVRSAEAAAALSHLLGLVADAVGLELRTIVSDGSAPIGRGIGPALEAHDVLAVLRAEVDAPADLSARAVSIAGALLELSGHCPVGAGAAAAGAAVTDGRARRKLEAICEAQGGLRTPGRAPHIWPLEATRAGRVKRFDNRKLARAAKLAGAPFAKTAGALVRVTLRSEVERGEPLFELHAETRGELDYAREYLAAHSDVVEIEGAE